MPEVGKCTSELSGATWVHGIQEFHESEQSQSFRVRTREWRRGEEQHRRRVQELDREFASEVVEEPLELINDDEVCSEEVNAGVRQYVPKLGDDLPPTLRTKR
jgi:hypothetical protein